jgi:hypothetical protein
MIMASGARSVFVHRLGRPAPPRVCLPAEACSRGPEGGDREALVSIASDAHVDDYTVVEFELAILVSEACDKFCVC